MRNTVVRWAVALVAAAAVVTAAPAASALQDGNFEHLSVIQGGCSACA
ncbi:hypothetical protein ACIA8O_07160 [Kitasatospora sp. NPDC051853]